MKCQKKPQTLSGRGFFLLSVGLKIMRGADNVRAMRPYLNALQWL